MGSYSWSTENTKLAACLGGPLDLPIRLQVTQDVRSGKVLTQFFVGPKSVRLNPPYQRDLILKAWKDGSLEDKTPLHPFLMGTRAEHNYDLLLDAQKQGRRIRLVTVGNGFATEYRDGEEDPEMVNARDCFRLADLSLVASLGTLGLPCIRMDWDGKKHIYTLPVEGKLLTLPDGSRGRYNGINIGMRKEPGKTPLLIEDRDPNHPLVWAYHTRQTHGRLLKMLAKETRLLLIRPEGTQRKAIVSENAAGRVMDKVNEEMES